MVIDFFSSFKDLLYSSKKLFIADAILEMSALN